MQVGTWLDFLREILRKSPGCRVLLIDEPPDWDAAASYQPEEIPVLQVSVDRDAQQVTLHTEADEDAPFAVPGPMLLSDLVSELESGAEGTFEMLWVSGWQNLPEAEFDVDQDGEGPYRVRLAAPLIGVGHPDDLGNVRWCLNGRVAPADARCVRPTDYDDSGGTGLLGSSWRFAMASMPLRGM
jgi:hypothetical protein